MASVLHYIVLSFTRGLSAAIIRSRLSAIAFWHQLNGWPNPIDSFLVRKAILGASKLQPPTPLCKVPVTPILLLCMLQLLQHMGLSEYDVLLFCTVLTLAFFAFLRVGEYTASPHALLSSDVCVSKTSLTLQF